jgi:hypothetical protein
MSIGLGISRSSRQDLPISGSRATVREVCLLGATGCARTEPWTTGERIVWLGRDYQVVSTSMPTNRSAPRGRPVSDENLNAASARDYVHLGPCDGF